MSNKIVQLQDEEGNAIFPIAGGVGADTISSSAIMDGAVTVDKLSLSYSESEQATGETWINGKMIYRKTISLGSLPNDSTKKVNHNISNMDSLIEIKGAAKFPSYQVPLPFVCDPLSGGLGVDGAIRIYIDSTQITVDTGYNRSGGTGYVTLYYTKSS